MKLIIYFHTFVLYLKSLCIKINLELFTKNDPRFIIIAVFNKPLLINTVETVKIIIIKLNIRWNVYIITHSILIFDIYFILNKIFIQINVKND